MKPGRHTMHDWLLCHNYGSTYCASHLRRRIASKETAIGHHSLTHFESLLPSLNPELAHGPLPPPGADGNVGDPVLL